MKRMNANHRFAALAAAAFGVTAMVLTVMAPIPADMAYRTAQTATAQTRA